MRRPRSSSTSGRSIRRSSGKTRRSRKSTTRSASRTRQQRETGTALLLLLPLFGLVVGLSAYPFYRAVPLSFTDKLVGYPERWVGLRNYIYLVNDDTFRTVVRNSLVFTVVSVALKILTGLAMALVLHATWRWRNFFRGLLLLPWITSTVIIALTWRWMFDAFTGRGVLPRPGPPCPPPPPAAASSTACCSPPASSPGRSPSWPRRRAPWPPSSSPTGGAGSRFSACRTR